MLTTLYFFGVVVGVIAFVVFVSYLSDRLRLSRRLGLRPPWSNALQTLKEAVRSGTLDPTAPIDSVEIGSFFNVDSLVWVEVIMASEETGQKLETVADLIRLLEIMIAEYEDSNR